jgi:hypothetical protein
MSISLFPQSFPSSNGPLTRKVTLTSSQTWTHPDGASDTSPKEVFVIAFGGGGAGGSGGARKVPGTQPISRVLAGGGGGTGGICGSLLTITGNASVVVGSAGVGPAGILRTAVGKYNGIKGGDGGNSSFSQNGILGTVFAPGGEGGGGGEVDVTLGYGFADAYDRAPFVSGGQGASRGGNALMPDPSTNNASNGRPGTADGLGSGGFNGVFFRFLSGSGGGGGSAYAIASGGNFRGNLGGAGGTSPYGNGGAGGNAEYSNFGTGIAGSGGNATGIGAGGGGGGSSVAGIDVRNGGGGNGSAGQVIIYY